MFAPSFDFAFENSRLFRALVKLPHHYLLDVLQENILQKRKYGKDYGNKLPWLLTPARIFLYSYLLVFFFRLLFLSFCLLENQKKLTGTLWIIKLVDPVLWIVSKEISSSAMFGFCLAPMVLFMLAIEILLHAKPNLYFWKVFYELLIENERRFWALNPRIHYGSVKVDLGNLFRTSTEAKKYLIRLLSYQKPVFASRLPHFRNVHPLIRYRILLISLGYRQVLKVILFMQNIALSFGWFGYFYLLVKYYGFRSPVYLLCGGLDAAIILYTFKRSFSQLNFFMLNVILLMTTYTLHLRALNRLLADVSSQKAVQKGRYSNFGSQAGSTFDLDLYQFYRCEQMAISMEIYRLNEAFVSLLTFLGIGSNVLANIYLVTSLVYGRRVELYYQAITIGGIILQIGGIYEVALPLIMISGTLYSGANYFYTLHKRKFHWKFTELKVALSHYYELLNTEERVVFRLGYVGNFTNNWLFQFFMFYTGYLIYFFKTFRAADEDQDFEGDDKSAVVF